MSNQEDQENQDDQEEQNDNEDVKSTNSDLDEEKSMSS